MKDSAVNNKPNGSTAQSAWQLACGAWEATAGHRPRFFLFIGLFVASYTLDLLSPFAIGYILEAFVKEGFTDAAFQQCQIGIAAFITIKLAYTFCHHFARYLQITTAFSARMQTLRQIFSMLLAFPLNWHVKHHSGENLSRLHRSAGAVEASISTYVWQISEGMVKVVFASVAILALDVWVAVNVIMMGIVTVLIMILFNQKHTRLIRRNNAFYDRLNRICVDYLFNIVTIKSLRLERNAERYLVNTEPEGLSACKQTTRLSELKWGSVGFGYSIVIGSSLLIYFSGHRGGTEPFSVAQVYVLLNYLDRIFQAIGSFTGYYSGIIESATAYEDATSIKKDRALHVSEDNGGALPPDWSTIDIQKLDFRYALDQNDNGILAENFRIRRGDKIALVGPSGSGKSTLLKVLGGMLIPHHSSVLLNGSTPLKIEDIARDSLLLPQEPEVFTETVWFNMTMGEDFEAQKLQDYLSLCRVDEVIAKLPKGWDSDLAEKGLNLSVGEKQRLAMARGLLRAEQRELLLLDEPTSSLDPMTEKKIFLGILNHFRERTVLTACHRLALVPLFDTIVFVRYGRIQEIGSFPELLARRGLFFQAWNDYEKKVRARDEEPEMLD